MSKLTQLKLWGFILRQTRQTSEPKKAVVDCPIFFDSGERNRDKPNHYLKVLHRTDKWGKPAMTWSSTPSRSFSFNSFGFGMSFECTFSSLSVQKKKKKSRCRIIIITNHAEFNIFLMAFTIGFFSREPRWSYTSLRIFARISCIFAIGHPIVLYEPARGSKYRQHHQRSKNNESKNSKKQGR